MEVPIPFVPQREGPSSILILLVLTADFISFTNRILRNAGIQKPVNSTAPFSTGNLNISGFEGQKFFNKYWSYMD
jgi:hypothetical protein